MNNLVTSISTRLTLEDWAHIALIYKFFLSPDTWLSVAYTDFPSAYSDFPSAFLIITYVSKPGE